MGTALSRRGAPRLQVCHFPKPSGSLFPFYSQGGDSNEYADSPRATGGAI